MGADRTDGGMRDGSLGSNTDDRRDPNATRRSGADGVDASCAANACGRLALVPSMASTAMRSLLCCDCPIKESITDGCMALRSSTWENASTGGFAGGMVDVVATAALLSNCVNACMASTAGGLGALAAAAHAESGGCMLAVLAGVTGADVATAAAAAVRVVGAPATAPFLDTGRPLSAMSASSTCLSGPGGGASSGDACFARLGGRPCLAGVSFRTPRVGLSGMPAGWLHPGVSSLLPSSWGVLL